MVCVSKRSESKAILINDEMKTPPSEKGNEKCKDRMIDEMRLKSKTEEERKERVDA